MDLIAVEGFDRIEGWHFGGYYDLDDPEDAALAEAAVAEMRTWFHNVRKRKLIDPNRCI